MTYNNKIKSYVCVLLKVTCTQLQIPSLLYSSYWAWDTQMCISNYLFAGKPTTLNLRKTCGFQSELPSACLSKVYCSFHISASILERNLYALCSGGRSKALHRSVYSWRVLLLNAVFSAEEESLMTAFIVNEQPVSGGCYCANCPLFKGSLVANSTGAGLAWKTFPTVRYCLPSEWLPFASAPNEHRVCKLLQLHKHISFFTWHEQNVAINAELSTLIARFVGPNSFRLWICHVLPMYTIFLYHFRMYGVIYTTINIKWFL